jgi:glyoxylase-like metal-dependent hydrolase (beta-lactamase superfamily II)
LSAVDLWFLEAGSCTHPEKMVLAGGRRVPVRFGSSVAVIEHPRHGVVLFDTGYSPRFHQATRPFPQRLYALVTPVTIAPEETAVHQLRARGIAAEDVRTVVLSHFHADHVGGAADFPRAAYLFQRSAYESLRHRGAFASVRAGFLPALLPQDFEQRARPLDLDQARPGLCIDARPGWDLFGDGTVVLVDLPGHAPGHSGLFVQASDGYLYFLVADACWTARAYRERRYPNPLTRLVLDDWSQYRSTLDDLHAFAGRHPEVRIVPCHCAETHAEMPRQRPAAWLAAE